MTALSACLAACGDNLRGPPDAATEDAAGFQPALHAPMPLALPHKGVVLSTVQLVTVTFADHAARADAEAFGDAVLHSSWFATVSAEYGVRPVPPDHVTAKLDLGPSPRSLTRGEIAAAILELVATSAAPRPTAVANQVVYLVYIPPTVERGPDLQGLRGYHEMLRLDPAGQSIRFPIAVVLDDDAGLADLTVNAAHQLIDAVTNPYEIPNDGYYTDPPMTDPWSLVHGEVADLCQGETPFLEQGFAYPRVYSNLLSIAGKPPCKPAGVDDTWSDVTARPSRIQSVPSGGSISFELTGWSTHPLADWTLTTRAAELSTLTVDQLRPTFDRDTINNGQTVTLTLHAPADARAGARGAVYVLSGESRHPWVVGFIVD